jgi:hypothetical protein
MSKQLWVVEITTTSVYQLGATSEQDAIISATGEHQDRNFKNRVDMHVDAIDAYLVGDEEEFD